MSLENKSGHRRPHRDLKVLQVAHLLKISMMLKASFPGHADSKESACKAGDPVSLLGLESSPGEVFPRIIQYSCLENSVDRGA